MYRDNFIKTPEKINKKTKISCLSSSLIFSSTFSNLLMCFLSVKKLRRKNKKIVMYIILSFMTKQ